MLCGHFHTTKTVPEAVASFLCLCFKPLGPSSYQREASTEVTFESLRNYLCHTHNSPLVAFKMKGFLFSSAEQQLGSWRLNSSRLCQHKAAYKLRCSFPSHQRCVVSQLQNSCHDNLRILHFYHEYLFAFVSMLRLYREKRMQ